MSVQDVNAKTDLGANSPRGLVCVRGFEGCVLSHSDSTASQTVSEVCFRGHSVPILCSPVRVSFSPTHLFKVHGCSSFPPQIEWGAHPQLFGRLADFSSVPGHAYQPHRLAAYSLGVPRTMCQHAEEHSNPESVHHISGSVLRLRGKESPPLVRARGGHFRQGSSVQLKKFQRLLGLMAAASAVCHLGLLHMRPLQLWLKTRVPWTSGCLNITVSRGCIEALKPWHNPDLFSRGVPLSSVVSRVVVTTDASTHGWGAVCDGMPLSGLWLKPQSQWHINRLELEAVFLALKEFQPQLEQQHVLIRTDNTSVVSNINHQGGIRSRALCKRATDILLWVDCNLLSIRATHIPGLLNRGQTCFRGRVCLKESGDCTPSRFG